MKRKTILYFFILELIVLTLFIFCQDGKNLNHKNNIKPTQKIIANVAKIENGISKVNIKTTGNNMMEMAFEPNFIKVKQNTKVEITIQNIGKDETMVHNLLIVKKGKIDEVGLKAIRSKKTDYVPKSDFIIAASPLVKPLETKTFIFDAPAVGEYGFLCTYPGHYMKMRGKFVVVE